MSLDETVNILKKIYALYDDVTEPFDTACRRFCAHCCTRNVTMTSLEGYLLFSGISRTYLDNIISHADRKKFVPRITTNGIAERCLAGEDLPEEEEADPLWGPCPILTDDECPFYEVRPFGCRCFMSKINCGKAGYADVDPYIISLNNVFLQYIEHIDSHGFSGNFSDVLKYFSIQENLDAYKSGLISSSAGSLITNRPMKSLLVPPEHRERIMPVINKINRVH